MTGFITSNILNIHFPIYSKRCGIAFMNLEQNSFSELKEWYKKCNLTDLWTKLWRFSGKYCKTEWDERFGKILCEWDVFCENDTVRYLGWMKWNCRNPDFHYVISSKCKFFRFYSSFIICYENLKRTLASTLFNG